MVVRVHAAVLFMARILLVCWPHKFGSPTLECETATENNPYHVNLTHFVYLSSFNIAASDILVLHSYKLYCFK